MTPDEIAKKLTKPQIAALRKFHKPDNYQALKVRWDVYWRLHNMKLLYNGGMLVSVQTDLGRDVLALLDEGAS